MTSLELRTNNRIVEINGETYKLDFDMQALSYAEQIYTTHYDRELNVSDIIKEIFAMKVSALAAFIYGALRSAGEKITWDEFSKRIFTYANFDLLFDVAVDAVEALLAPADGDSAQANEKN